MVRYVGIDYLGDPTKDNCVLKTEAAAQKVAVGGSRIWFYRRACGTPAGGAAGVLGPPVNTTTATTTTTTNGTTATAAPAQRPAPLFPLQFSYKVPAALVFTVQDPPAANLTAAAEAALGVVLERAVAQVSGVDEDAVVLRRVSLAGIPAVLPGIDATAVPLSAEAVLLAMRAGRLACKGGGAGGTGGGSDAASAAASAAAGPASPTECFLVASLEILAQDQEAAAHLERLARYALGAASWSGRVQDL